MTIRFLQLLICLVDAQNNEGAQGKPGFHVSESDLLTEPMVRP